MPGTSATTESQVGGQIGNQTSSPVFGSPASSSQPISGQTSTGGGSVASSASTQIDSQVTTIVQQFNRQGPAVIQRISSQLGDLVCSEDTVQNLVSALHDGQPVTLKSTVNGQPQSAPFNPTGKRLGYGEIYIALSLAAEQLRNSGVTGCATSDQWQAVLLGGQLAVHRSSTGSNTFASASSSTTVPGILTLRNQGQGWGQIARSANVQLGQIVSNASVSGFSSVDNLDPNRAGAPTGHSSTTSVPDRESTTIGHGNEPPKSQQKDEWLGDRNNSGANNRYQTPGNNTHDRSAYDPSREPATDTGTADSTPGTAQPVR